MADLESSIQKGYRYVARAQELDGKRRNRRTTSMTTPIDSLTGSGSAGIHR
jgi:hypothetical protein